MAKRAGYYQDDQGDFHRDRRRKRDRRRREEPVASDRRRGSRRIPLRDSRFEKPSRVVLEDALEELREKAEESLDETSDAP